MRFQDRRVIILLGIALGARVAWAAWIGNAIHDEGTYYARLGENILRGRGFLGMSEPGLQLIFPPLYPLTIAAVTAATSNSEWAGRLVSIVAGALLVLPAVAITRRYLSEPAAIVAGLLVALHPMLVGVSAGVYSDALYLLCLFTGLWWGMLARDEDRILNGVLSGSALALAYLTRPEALAFPVLLCALILFRHVGGTKAALMRSAALVASFAALSIPYVLFLWNVTGSFRLETKSADNYAQGVLRDAGVNGLDIYFGIDDDLTERGISLMSNLDVMREYQPSAAKAFRFLLRGAAINGPRVARGLTQEPAVGGPLLLVLVSLGLFGAAWSAGRAWHEVTMVGACAALLAALATLHVFWARYLMPFVPFLMIWAATGHGTLKQWGHATAGALGLPDPLGSRLGTTLAAGALTATLGFSLWGSRSVLELRPGDPSIKVVGRWVREDGGTGRKVMGQGPGIAFYAGAVRMPLPSATPETSLRYVAAKDPDYVVLRTIHRFPCSVAWMRDGIPDPRAQLAYRYVAAPGDTIFVYRWESDRREPIRNKAGGL